MSELNCKIQFWSDKEQQELQELLEGVATEALGQIDTPELRAAVQEQMCQVGQAWLLLHPPKVQVCEGSR